MLEFKENVDDDVVCFQGARPDNLLVPKRLKSSWNVKFMQDGRPTSRPCEYQVFPVPLQEAVTEKKHSTVTQLLLPHRSAVCKPPW